MDYSKFLDDNFDAKEWINAAFQANKDAGTPNDQYATTLVMKLQLLVQEVNNVIEETSQEVVSNLPRVLRDIQIVKQESTMLQDQMKAIKEDIQKVEKDTSESMQSLLKLDAIKSRMEQTSEALRQADNWTVLSTEVEDVIQSGDADLLASKVVAMQQSLRLLAKVPDYDDRCQHLEAIKNRLESLVSAAVVSAISTGHQEKTRYFVSMFESINRLPQIYKYYKHYHKSQLSKTWSQYIDSDNSLPGCLYSFYDNVLSTFHSQVSWCNCVFSEPLEIVLDMITVTLSSCEQSIGTQISAYLDAQESDTLTLIVELKQVTDRFTESMEKSLIEKTKSPQLLTGQLIEDLAQAIYTPYLPYMQDYMTLEGRFLKEQLDAIDMGDRRFIDTSVSKLSSSVAKVFKVASQVNERCASLTAGVGYVYITDIFKKYFSEYSSEVKRIIVNISEKFKNQQCDQEQLDSWTMFSHSLKVIQLTGDIISKAEDLDQSVVANVLLLGDDIQRTSISALRDIQVVYVKNEDQRLQLAQLIETVTESQTALPSSLRPLRALSEHAHKLAFDSVFSQIAHHLYRLSDSEVWMSESAGGALTADLPTFSLSPQEYITQIGQYIMTLPQYLDPFAIDSKVDDDSEVIGKMSLQLALKYGRLPYVKFQDGSDMHMDAIWLESVSKATMNLYCEEVLRIPEISVHASRQLVTDIEYFINVLDDLGIVPIDQLVSIRDLMKASPEEYSQVSQTAAKSLSKAIHAMRNLAI